MKREDVDLGKRKHAGHSERKGGISQSELGSRKTIGAIDEPMRDPSHPFGMTCRAETPPRSFGAFLRTEPR